VDGPRHAVSYSIFKQHWQKSNMFDFCPVLPEFLAILLAAAWTVRLPLLLTNEQQRISACFLLWFGFNNYFWIVIRLLAVKMAEDETVTVCLK
jgi:hypothetical protein